MCADMNDRLERLFEAERKTKPDTSAIEEHFETRLMARIQERQTKNTPWYMLAWRMIPVFTVIAALIAICSISFNPVRSQDMFAAIANGQEDYVAGSFLTGE